MKRLFACIMTAIFVCSGINALDLKDGRIKITLHEKFGRFTPYFLDDISKNTWVPFLIDQDPRTTKLSIIENNKIYIMGESASFRQTLEQTEKGAAFVWTSGTLIIREEFSFTKSSQSPISDGLKINITIENTSNDTLSVGVRYLFDTYLGENEDRHFFTDAAEKINTEIDFVSSIPYYWVSPVSKKNTPGFQVMTSGSGITTPNRIIFANWSRLDDNSWNFDVNKSRNFNYPPYSINDSAVAQYYNPNNLAPKSKIEIILVMGSYNQTGFSGDTKNVNSQVTELFEQTIKTEAVEDISLGIKTDLITVQELLDEIDRKIKNNESVGAQELSLMKQIIQNLKSRKAEYEK